VIINIYNKKTKGPTLMELFTATGKLKKFFFFTTRVVRCRVLRRVFGPKRDEVTGEWRKLGNEELSDLYSLPNIVRVVKSRRMRWARNVVCMGERRVLHRVLVGKSEGKSPLRRPRRR
jgi:hypothetical protein